MHTLKRFHRPLALMALLLSVFSLFFTLPTLHRSWLRHSVASRVFEVKGVKDGGGGTGFQVQAPSGENYIVTNSHVCEHSLKAANSKNILLVIRGEHAMKRRVLEISDRADLCLIEGWPGVEGLKLGSERDIGDMVIAVGHPMLGPTTMTMGELRDFVQVEIVHHVMPGPNKAQNKGLQASDEPCEGPKFEVKMQKLFFFGIPMGEAKMCMVKETDAMQTNTEIYPGSSGSPVVDRWGRVVGVMFASDNRSNWGYAVNLENLAFFLKDF